MPPPTARTKSAFALYNAGRDALQRQLDSYYAFTYSLEQTMTELQALRTRIEQSAGRSQHAEQQPVEPHGVAEQGAGANPHHKQHHPVAENPGSRSARAPPAARPRPVTASCTMSIARSRPCNGSPGSQPQGRIADLETQLKAPLPTVSPDLVGRSGARAARENNRSPVLTSCKASWRRATLS